MRRILFFFCLLAFALPAAASNYNETSADLPKLRATYMPDIHRKFDEKNLILGSPVYIRIFKNEQILELWVRSADRKTYKLFKSYSVCNSSGVLGPKLKEGDHQAPEGFYTVTEEWMHPNSQYYLAFNLGYPNEYDKAHARTGSALMVHGGCKSTGCFSMRNRIMGEIYLIMEKHFEANGPGVPVPVHIFPFRMTKENMDKGMQYYPQWMSFWLNLKEGYDLFEALHIPPKTLVMDKKYYFQ